MVITFLRTIILYLLIIIGIRLMGKRQVGELEPSELVLALIIADLAAVPMQDLGIPLLAGIVPILTLLSLTMVISVLNLRSIRSRALLCGRPSIVVEDGVVVEHELRRNRFTLDELMVRAAPPGGHRPQHHPLRHSGDQRPALGPSARGGAPPHPQTDGPADGGRRTAPPHHQRWAGHGAQLTGPGPEPGVAHAPDGRAQHHPDTGRLPPLGGRGGRGLFLAKEARRP